MPTEIFEDTIDLEIELLETLPIEVGPAYPMPRLRKTGGKELRTFRTVILENAYLRATIIPALGGRIWGIFDKRTATEILPSSSNPEFKSGGRRGVTLDAGITLQLDGEPRLNDLGSVATTVEEGEDPAVWLAETSVARGFSFHQRISMPHDRAELVIEVRIVNRTTEVRGYQAGLSFFCGEGRWENAAFYSKERKTGFGLLSEDAFPGAEFSGEALHFRRADKEEVMVGRLVDTWMVRIVPISGLPEVSGFSELGAYLIDSKGAIQVQVSEEALSHKLVLLTEDDRSLEAPVDLYPEHILEITPEQAGAKIKAIVVLDQGKNEMLRGPHQANPASESVLLRDFLNAGTRHLSLTSFGMNALRVRDLAKADAYFERALMYNADDPLLWWEKGLVRRLVEPDEENPERLNAHYLAPLEPALRAEAFLGQPLDMGREKSPLLTPLEETPEDFVEVACMYIEHGLLDQASRWLDEALRHVDLPMLRILMAYCLIKGTRMDAEAAEQLGAAARNPGPPYPWRQVELEAMATLNERFPGNAYLVWLRDLGKASA